MIKIITGSLIILLAWRDILRATPFCNRTRRRSGLADLFYQSTWLTWSAVARRMKHGYWREALFHLYLPVTLLLFICTITTMLMLGFALLHTAITTDGSDPHGTPSPSILALSALQSFIRYGFCIVVAAHLIALYKEHVRRKAKTAEIVARLGHPQNMVNLLLGGRQALVSKRVIENLGQLERWSAELLVSNRAHPVLCRAGVLLPSHSWLSAQTAIMDASAALIAAAKDDALAAQARHTFAMARRVVVEAAELMEIPTRTPARNRYLLGELADLHQALAAAISVHEEDIADERLILYQNTYEPYVHALADYLLTPLPFWEPPSDPIIRIVRH